MMLNLYVQQHQWVVVALMTGIALVLLFWLTYKALWRPRKDEALAEEIRVTGIVSFFDWLLSFMPWVVILLIVGSLVFTVLYVMSAGIHAPTW